MKEPWSWRKLVCRLLGHRRMPPINDAPMTFCRRCGSGVPS